MSERAVHHQATLVGKAKSGDHAAFLQLVGAHRQRLYALARRFAETVEDAEDLTQETLVRAYRHFGKFRPDADFGPWVTKIAVNTCLTYRSRRRSQRQREATARTLAPSAAPRSSSLPHAAVERRADLERIHAEIAALPKRQRMAVILYELEGLSIPEAAELMACATGTVKRHLYRARRTLAAHLADLLDEAPCSHSSSGAKEED